MSPLLNTSIDTTPPSIAVPIVVLNAVSSVPSGLKRASRLLGAVKYPPTRILPSA